MRFAILASTLIWSFAASAQESAKPAITPDEVMEKAIQATGGREAAIKLTSLVAKGALEVVSMGVTAPTELYWKAPDKRTTITMVDGYGDVRQGYDGKIAWSAEPQNGVVDVTGNQLASTRREAQFNGDLRWKELYKSAEVTGKEKVGARDCWVLKFTPAEGTPVTRYYDAETFLLARTVSTGVTPEGPAEIQALFSDWRDLPNGTKAAHTVSVTLPGIGELVTRYKEYLVNVEIDDARFAKPKN